MSKFDSLKIGDKAEITHTITQKDIENFVELTGDDNKLHVDNILQTGESESGSVLPLNLSALLGTGFEGE